MADSGAVTDNGDSGSILGFMSWLYQTRKIFL
jgi:hypothetical protein